MQINHPLTGRPLAAVGFRNPRASRGEVGLQPIMPIMGGSGTDAPPAGGDADAAAKAAAEAKATADKQVADKKAADEAAAKAAADKARGAGEDGKTDAERGYPLKTPVEDMEEAQRTAYWRAIAREHEASVQELTGRGMTPKKVAALLKAQEEAEEAAKTELERAVDAARKEGAESARADAQASTVKALIAAHVVAANLDEKKDADVLETFGTLNHSSFVTADGSIDAVKLSKVLNRLAPVGGKQSGTPWPATGQGNQNTGTGSARDAGRAEAERRGFIKPAATK